MKKVLCCVVAALLLAGCGGGDENLDRGMGLRAKMIASTVAFDADISADYGDMRCDFSMRCEVGTDGTMTFQVTKPESIAGITGSVGAQGGKLTFDDVALAFGTMADGQISPVSAPWVLVRTLRGGYLTSCTQEGELLRLSIDDSYQEDALHLDIWLGSGDIPQTADIYWQGRRLLSIGVSKFTLA